MKQFQGFPSKMDFTPIPNPFFNRLLPYISDITELKTALYVFMSIYNKKGHPRFVSRNELLNNTGLTKCLAQDGKPPREELDKALSSIVDRGIILRLTVKKDGQADDIYLLNTPSDNQAVAKIQSGELELPKMETINTPPPNTEEAPNIFVLYEENVGMLTPLIADDLKEAEKLYPFSWIEDAFKIAVKQNVRKWGYISAILERWSKEGKNDGTHKRDAEKEDPDKYIKGDYGHMVQR